MPVDLIVDVEHRLVVLKGYDKLTGPELMEVDTKLRTDTRVQPDFNQMMDCSDITERAVSTDDLYALSRRAPFFRSTSKHAVIGRGPLDFGSMRMFEILRDGAAGHWQFFETRDAAERWLVETGEP